MSRSSAIPPTPRVTPDPASVIGKQPPIDASTDLLIVGAGAAGLGAALRAAERGIQVTLVDENPIPLATMGEDVPLHFGGRMAPSLANRNATLERVLSCNPKLMLALDRGVDVRLGTAVWGLFPAEPTARWIDGHVAGLADEDSAYLMRFRQVIVAAGRRDMGLAFEGWQRPGVMGVSAAYRLAVTYDALQSRTAVLLGGDAASLRSAVALADAGVRILAIVEQGERVRGEPRDLQRLVDGGARVLTRHVIERAEGDAYGVTAVQVAAVEANGRQDLKTRRFDCDTVLIGVAAVPVVELLEACGCATQFEPARGGHVARIDGAQRTSLPFIYAVGDCAGIWPAKCAAPDIAEREGCIAAAAALRALGADGEPDEIPVVPDDCQDGTGELLAWVRASVVNARCDLEVCQCEAVSAAAICSLKAPAYLNWTAAKVAAPASLDPDQPVSPDAVKRLTRAGMGSCQGRRCREQIAALMALQDDAPLEAVPLASYRPPVRPLSLKLLASLPEAAATAAHWDSWFGMPGQWVPFWRVAPRYRDDGTGDEPAGCE